VPALLSLLGDRSWTIPRWLDRALPNITIEPPEERRPDRPPVTTGEPVPVAD
jgi:RND superfamily putative drug exporter